MAKNRYEESSDPYHCSHPNQTVHDYPDGRRVVFCPGCGSEWS